ncbi:hypothetical protein Tco_1116393 [Tanacetum coccineum]
MSMSKNPNGFDATKENGSALRYQRDPVEGIRLLGRKPELDLVRLGAGGGVVKGCGVVFGVVRSSLGEKLGGARGVVGGESCRGWCRLIVTWRRETLENGRIRWIDKTQARKLILAVLLSDLFSFLLLEDLGIVMINIWLKRMVMEMQWRRRLFVILAMGCFFMRKGLN